MASDEVNKEDLGLDYRRELNSYFWGLALALGLTGVAFALVNWAVLPQFPMLLAIGGFGILQILVHFRFFLHIDLSSQKREDLHLILFTTLILFVMIGGTIWIMTSLATRMGR